MKTDFEVFNDPKELAKFYKWKEEQEERKRKRGKYWLSEEGRSEVQEIWHDEFHDLDRSSAIAPVYLVEIERLEKEIEWLKDEIDHLREMINGV